MTSLLIIMYIVYTFNESYDELNCLPYTKDDFRHRAKIKIFRQKSKIYKYKNSHTFDTDAPHYYNGVTT